MVDFSHFRSGRLNGKSSNPQRRMHARGEHLACRHLRFKISIFIPDWWVTLEVAKINYSGRIPENQKVLDSSRTYSTRISSLFVKIFVATKIISKSMIFSIFWKKVDFAPSRGQNFFLIFLLKCSLGLPLSLVNSSLWAYNLNFRVFGTGPLAI